MNPTNLARNNAPNIQPATQLVLTPDLDGLDMVVALGQSYINTQFAFKFGQPGGIQKNLNIWLDDKGYHVDPSEGDIGGIIDKTTVGLKALMGVPQVKLSAASAGVLNRTVFFILTLETGYFNWRKSLINPNSSTEQTPIKNWQLGFRVNLDTSVVDETVLRGIGLEGNPKKEEILKNIEDLKKAFLNMGDGMFSINQLFMDFQNANLSSFEPSLSSIDGQPLNTLTSPEQSFLTTLINEFLSSMKEEGHHILGYALNVKKPEIADPQAPTFPPTAFNFATNTYTEYEKDAKGNPIKDASGLYKVRGNQDYDTLNYQIMTQNHGFPLNLKTYTGNWITPEEGNSYGVFAIKRELILDQYLLPNIAKSVNVFAEVKGIDDTEATYTWTNEGEGIPFEKINYDFNSTNQIASLVKESQAEVEEDGDISHWNNKDRYYRYKLESFVSIDEGAGIIIVDTSYHMGFEREVWYGIRGHAASDTLKVGVTAKKRLEISLHFNGDILDITVNETDFPPKIEKEEDDITLDPEASDRMDNWANDMLSRLKKAN